MSDLIDRQAAIDAVRGMQTYKLFEYDDMLLIDKSEVMTELMMLPSAQQKPNSDPSFTQDCIDRQAALDAIEKLYLPQTKGETAAEDINRVAWRCALNCAEEMIGHLPSAQPTQTNDCNALDARWIPVSEKLPDKDGRYLVSCSNWGSWTVDCNIWCTEPKPSWIYGQEVVAWMPLPEPYGGEKE